MPRVYNKHHKDAPEDAVYVGRPTKWGSPFALDPKRKGADRSETIHRYALWLAEEAQSGLRADARVELRGRDLVCFCHPKPCHADLLLEVANSGE